MPKDSKAEHGYEPNWNRQRDKQDEVATNYYERLHGEIEEWEPEEGEDE